MIAEHSVETIGYYSVINGALEEPVFKFLNVEAIKKINHEGIPLDCSSSVEIVKNKPTVDHLLAFLKKKVALKDIEHNDRETNVVCKAPLLRKLLLVEPRHKTERKYKFRKITDLHNTIVIEDDIKVEEKEHEYTHKGEVIQILLNHFENGISQKRFGLVSLYLAVKHRYVYQTGQVVNLFVSSEVWAVFKHNREVTPINLVYNTATRLQCPAQFEYATFRRSILGFLVGVKPLLIALRTEDHEAEKVFMIDDPSFFCSKVLNNFEKFLPKFLREIVQLEVAEGQLRSPPPYYKGDSPIPYQIIEMSTEQNIWFKMADATSTFVKLPKGDSPKKPTEHELVIIGTTHSPIPYTRKYKKPLYNADFITLKHFNDGIYVDFLKEPKRIKFFGTNEEREQLLSKLTEAQRSIMEEAKKKKKKKNVLCNS